MPNAPKDESTPEPEAEPPREEAETAAALTDEVVPESLSDGAPADEVPATTPPAADAASDARPPGPKSSPNEGPPADERSLMLAGWSCIGLIAATCLGIYILFASAFTVIDDPTDGMVTETPEAEVEATVNDGHGESVRERVVRPGVQWETNYEAARERAQAADRALLLLFTADFSTESLDLKDGTFTDPRVIAHVERAFVPVHVDLTDPTPAASAVAERFGVQFTPHVVYVDATHQNRLAMDTMTLVDPDTLLEDLSAAAP